MRSYQVKSLKCLAGVLVVSFFTLVSCGHVDNHSAGPVGVQTDTLLIDLPVSTSANLIQPAIWQADGVEYLCAYNYLDHSLSIINLTKRIYLTQVRLQQNGPDFVDTVNGIAYYGDGKLALSSLKHLTVVSSKGEVLERIRLNDRGSDISGFDFSRGRLEVNRNSGLQYDPHTDEVLLGAVRRELNGRLQKYIACLGISSKHVRLIELPGFESQAEGESYGNLNGFSFRRYGDSFIVNPRYASELVLLNGYTSHRFINSSITANKSIAYNRRQAESVSLLDHQMRNVEFYPVFNTYDSSYFFRIHKGALDEQSRKESFYMIITDHDFSKVLEKPFPENYYIQPVISREGIMFIAFDKHDGKLELIRYNFVL